MANLKNVNLNHSGNGSLVNNAAKRLFLLLSLAFLLNGCTTISNTGSPQPAEVEDRAVVNGEVLPFPDETNIQVESLYGQNNTSPVVQRLLTEAEQQRAAGAPEAAANSLERALRIEPQNAMLWSRLADVRYAQDDYQQAVQLAAKSNTLAASDQQLRRQNWYLMANAYLAMGSQQAAQKYRDKLSQ